MLTNDMLSFLSSELTDFLADNELVKSITDSVITIFDFIVCSDKLGITLVRQCQYSISSIDW